MSLIDDYKKTEKINGIVYSMPLSEEDLHRQINENIYCALRTQLKGSNCVVSMENLALYLSEDEYVIPDIMLISDGNQVKKDKYMGIPLFIVETMSPSTAFKDRKVKKHAYEKLGVDEYWIISPGSKTVEAYQLEKGEYRLVNVLMLEDDVEDTYYNGKTVLALKAMPSISIMLEEIFAGISLAL